MVTPEGLSPPIYTGGSGRPPSKVAVETAPGAAYGRLPPCSTLLQMQRLFTMFPAGAAGLALALLRLSVTGCLLLHFLAEAPAGSAWRLLSLGIISIFLLIGMATPVAGLIAAGIELMSVFYPLRLGTFVSAEILTGGIHAIQALSLALIGPGAFSVDARLFGRRVLTPS
jgi:hypothetical protein